MNEVSEVSVPENVPRYWQLPYEEWRKNYELVLPTKKSGKTEYVNYHVMVEALRQYCPGLIPELVSADILEDGTVVVKVQLWHNELSLPSATHRMAIMRLGGNMHNAVPNPDSRLMTDGIRRAYCRLIAEETGLGYNCWLREDDYAEPIGEAPALPWAYAPQPQRITQQQIQAAQAQPQQFTQQYEQQQTQNPNQFYGIPQQGGEQAPQQQQQWHEQWSADVFGELQTPVTEVAQPPQRRR